MMMQAQEVTSKSFFSNKPLFDTCRNTWDFQMNCCGSRHCQSLQFNSVKLCQIRHLRPATYHVNRQERPKRTLALAGSPVRWNLDDVERLSRGRPSKTKMGSRAVPHRLNADERKEFELAKKRGYVVQKAGARRYPLVNSYRNYCDALGVPCIRIEQGYAGSLDQVVIDLSPLHLSEADHAGLREKLVTAITEGISKDERIYADGSEDYVQITEQSDSVLSKGDSALSGLSDDVPVTEPESILSNDLDNGIRPLRFEASRSIAKIFSQTALDTWRTLSSGTESKLRA